MFEPGATGITWNHVSATKTEAAGFKAQAVQAQAQCVTGYVADS